MVYLVIIILLLCLSYHYDYQDHKYGKKEWGVICCLIFVLVAGLRYRLGVDTIEYENKYQYYPSLLEYFEFDFENNKFGRGFIFLMALSKSISSEFFVLQLIHASLVNSIIFYFFYKNTKHLFFALLLYFLLFYFSYNYEVLRESCAVAVFLLSWNYFKNSEWIKYYILCGIAILFHPSAAITICLPFLKLPLIRIFFKINKYFIILLAVVFILSSIVYVKFFDLLSLIEISQIEDYSNMYENRYNSEPASINIFGLLTYLVRFFIYPTLSIIGLKVNIRVDEKKDEKQTNNLQLVCCLFMYIAIASLFIQLLARFNNYFYPFVVIAISNFTFSRYRLRKVIYKFSYACWMVILIPYLFLSIYGFFKKDENNGFPLIRRYYPYTSVIFPEKDKQREQLFYNLGR